MAFFINIFPGSPGWNRQHHSQTIHPAGDFISMNLFKMVWLVIWECLFLTFMVMNAVTGQKHYSEHFSVFIPPKLCNFIALHPTAPYLEFYIYFLIIVNLIFQNLMFFKIAHIVGGKHDGIRGNKKHIFRIKSVRKQ